jgi:hypothetical protein
MLTTDDLVHASETVVHRVNLGADVPDAPWRIDHLDIARAGVEAGLELALRRLREWFHSASDSNLGCDHDHHGDLVSMELAAAESPERR